MAGLLAAPLCLGLLPGTALAADVPTLDPAEASAGFLLRAQGADGLIGGVGPTTDTVLGLVAAGIGGERLTAALDALETAAPTYGYDTAGTPLPAPLAKLVLALSAGGRDATSAGGRDLVADLRSTATTDGPDVGRLDDTDVDGFDSTGAFTQALGVLALEAADRDDEDDDNDAVTAAARSWLVGQQCADGGFEFGARAIDADGSRPACEAADTNTTGYAVQALAQASASTSVDAALGFLDAAQTASGGFPFIPPAGDEVGDADPTSTALSLQAIVAAGGSPFTARWTTESGGNPVSALVGDELACGAPVGDRGAFLGFQGTADIFATSSVLAGLAGADLPVAAAPGSTNADTPVVACGGLPPVPLTDACPQDAVTSAGFADVPAAGPFTQAIDCLAQGGIVRGTTATTFNPGGPVTRSQTVVLVARALDALGVDLDTTPAGFTDLAGESAEVSDAVNALSNLGVVNGTSATTFSPGATVSRGQEASFLARAIGVAPQPGAAQVLLPGLDTFTDDDVSVHESSIDALARAGVTSGTADGTYDPEGAVTREQSAAFLARALQVVLVANASTGPVGA